MTYSKAMTPEVRTLFPITERAIYFNHAAISPLPIPTLRAIEAQLKDVHENGSLNFRSWLAVKEKARELLAKLLGARPEQVAFMRNTSDALSTIANGLNWRPGDNIVTFSREFPSNIYPWFAFATYTVSSFACVKSAKAASILQSWRA